MASGVDFRAVFQGSPEPQLVLGPNDVVLAVTDGYLRAAGTTREQVNGRTLFEVPPYAGLDGDGTTRLRQELERVWVSGLQLPHQILGGYRSVAISVPVFDAAGTVQQVVHTLGQAGRSSEGLQSDGERRLRKLIEHSYDSLVLLDQTGKPFYVSPSTERVRGHSPEALLRISLLELIHPDDLPRFGNEVKKLLGHPGGVMVVQYRARHQRGHWQILETVAVNHLNDPDILAVVATTRDVTERVQLEETLRHRNEELQIAFDAAHAIGWQVSLGDRNNIRYSSDPAAFFGHALPPGQQFDLDQIVHPEDRAAVRDQMSTALQRGDDLMCEFRGVPRGAQSRHYATRGRLVRDAAGKSSRVVGVTWDVTERARLTAESAGLQRRMLEAQKLESLGVLAGGIAHDFNNILTAVLGNASLARLALEPTSPALESIAQIEEAARRATDLCRQMLAYAGKGRFVLQRTNLNELIESTTHLLQVSISKKAVLRLNLDNRLPPIVVDNTQIRQVLMNLVINASDAIGDRSGVISISTGVVRADRDYLDKTIQAPEHPGRRLRLRRGQRHRQRHDARGPGANLRAVLHLEVHRARAGVGRRVWDRARAQGGDEGLQRTRQGLELQAAAAGGRSTDRSAGLGRGRRRRPRAARDDPDRRRRGDRAGGRGTHAGGPRLRGAAGQRRAPGLEGLRGEARRDHGRAHGLTMPHLDGEEAFRELRRLDATCACCS